MKASARKAAAQPVTMHMTADMIGPSKLDSQAKLAIGLHESTITLDGSDAPTYSPKCLLGAMLAIGNKRERIVAVTKAQRGIYVNPVGEATDVLITDKGTEVVTANIVRAKLHSRLFTTKGTKLVANRSDCTNENRLLQQFLGERKLMKVGDTIVIVNVAARRKRARKNLEQDTTFTEKHADLIAAVANHNESNKKATTMKTVKAPAKKVAAKPAVKKVAAKTVKTARKPRLTNDQRQILAMQKFEASKLVSGLIATYVREQGEKIVTHVDQPEVKAILNRDVFVRDVHSNKLVKLGRVESALVSVSSYDMGLFNIYTVWVDDGAIALHQIRKEGSKFVYDAGTPMPNKRQTHLVDAADFDKVRGKKTTSNINPLAAVKREQDNQSLGYKAAAAKNAKTDLTVRERNDRDCAVMVYAEGELRASSLKKGEPITIAGDIRGDKIKMTKIVVEGKGTKASPFVKRRYVHTEKGQICPAFELKLVRGKLKNIAV